MRTLTAIARLFGAALIAVVLGASVMLSDDALDPETVLYVDAPTSAAPATTTTLDVELAARYAAALDAATTTASTTSTTAAPPPPTTVPAPVVTAPPTTVYVPPTAAPQAVYGSGACGGDLPPCWVMMRESGGDITAQNPTSTASGKWQILDSTWQGYGGYAKARYAPEWVQDDKARLLWAGGAGCGHWSACG